MVLERPALKVGSTDGAPEPFHALEGPCAALRCPKPHFLKLVFVYQNRSAFARLAELQAAQGFKKAVGHSVSR